MRLKNKVAIMTTLQSWEIQSQFQENKMQLREISSKLRGKNMKLQEIDEITRNKVKK